MPDRHFRKKYTNEDAIITSVTIAVYQATLAQIFVICLVQGFDIAFESQVVLLKNLHGRQPLPAS
jgi:hypothetical protein